MLKEFFYQCWLMWRNIIETITNVRKGELRRMITFENPRYVMIKFQNGLD